MGLVGKLDDLGKPAWIALMVLGFFAFWPIGLATLIFLLWSGRMGCWTNGSSNRWQRRMGRMQDKMDHMQRKAAEWSGQWSTRQSAPQQGPSSGNHAFDEYREETLRRLEEEQREFLDFLDRLRHAKDKAEFDQFMASRRPGQPGQGSAETGPSAQA